ncbi:substrate-binding periplasmic protein [Sneathiella glossodoripedis]|uniref:substrate-binding periplasmic protein n=1 Tax=Sneathiella glossodoripedis TaxID=418853 RepID=UPI0011DD6997|nr:transporter substrate-binding domain-containing protein [Sneathiella glossodoripedis]
MTILLPFMGIGTKNVLSAEQTVLFACNEFPPYKMENSESGLPGFDVEFLRESFKQVGITLQIQYMPWKRALDVARKGKVDGVCSCSSTKERAEYMYFSEPLGRASSGLFSLTSKNFELVNDLDEIGSRSVGVIKGYNLIEKLEAAGVQNVFELSSERQGLKMLLKGRLDFYYSYEAPTRYYLSQDGHSEKVHYHELSYTDYHSCISKASEGSEDLLKSFNEGLAGFGKAGSTIRFCENIADE